jgi:glutaredoxin 3
MIIVWSKDNCPWCEKAITLLESYNLNFELRKIVDGKWTREELLESIPSAKTVPQIVINGAVIGGYTELAEYIESTGFNGTGYTL